MYLVISGRRGRSQNHTNSLDLYLHDILDLYLDLSVLLSGSRIASYSTDKVIIKYNEPENV